MMTVEDVVDKVIDNMIQAQELFTALDVSNQVKKDLPLTRHREVRDLVRSKFASHIEPCGYAKTPIQVTLPDGSQVDALLYHPLVDSWDLDAKYDAQKRTQVPSSASTLPSAPANPVPQIMNISAVGTRVKPRSTNNVAPVVSSPNPRKLWDQMFQSQPSLFPRK